MGSYVKVELGFELTPKFKEDNVRVFSLLEYLEKYYNHDPEDVLTLPFTHDEWLDSEWRDVYEDIFNSSGDFNSIIRSVGELCEDEVVFKFHLKDNGNYEFKTVSGFKYRCGRLVDMQIWTNMFKPYIVEEELCGFYTTDDYSRKFFDKHNGWHSCDDEYYSRDYENFVLDKYNKNNISPYVFTYL